MKRLFFIATGLLFLNINIFAQNIDDAGTCLTCEILDCNSGQVVASYATNFPDKDCSGNGYAYCAKLLRMMGVLKPGQCMGVVACNQSDCNCEASKCMEPLFMSNGSPSSVLLNFDAMTYPNPSITKIYWDIKSQSNVYEAFQGFEIEKSKDLKKWSTLEMISPNEDATSYEYTDNKKDGTFYYRIQVIKADGSKVASEIMQIEVADGEIVKSTTLKE